MGKENESIIYAHLFLEWKSWPCVSFKHGSHLTKQLEKSGITYILKNLNRWTILVLARILTVCHNIFYILAFIIAYQLLLIKKSNPAPIAHGVPQGSVIGPLIFLVYMLWTNNLVACTKISLLFSLPIALQPWRQSVHGSLNNPDKTNLIKLLIKDKSDHKDLTGCTILGVIFNCVLNSHIKFSSNYFPPVS